MEKKTLSVGGAKLDDIIIPHELTSGGIFSDALCYEFIVGMNIVITNHLQKLQTVVVDTAGKNKKSMPGLWKAAIKSVSQWRRKDLIEEIQEWLTRVPHLNDLFRYSYTVILKKYMGFYPRVKEMGIRVPDLPDAMMALLRTFHDEPSVRTGEFLVLPISTRFSITMQHVSLMFLDAIVTLYFPRYSSATSAFARNEPSLRGELPTPANPSSLFGFDQ